MIKLKNVHAAYGESEILKGIDLELKPGKITAIAGINGCGKTTMLKCIGGMLPVKEGRIEIGGVSVNELSLTDLAKQVAYLAQSKTVPDITVERMVLHGRFPYLNYPRRYRPEDIETARRAMESLGIENLAEKPLAELSGGMRQKAYIAMALAQQAPVILMDEPTTYLDISQQLALGSLVRKLADSGKTVALVLHDLVYALKFADFIAVTHQGKIAAYGSPREVLESGIFREIYGVEIRTLETEEGTQYYYVM